MNQEGKVWLNSDNGKNNTEQGDNSKQPKPLSSDDVKEDEKLHGLVDEDHPFPSKGN